MKKQILHYKRILAGLLSAAMVFGAIPNPVFAEELIADEAVVETVVEDDSEDLIAEEEIIVATDEIVEEAIEEEIIDETAEVEEDVLTLEEAPKKEGKYTIDFSGVKNMGESAPADIRSNSPDNDNEDVWDMENGKIIEGATLTVVLSINSPEKKELLKSKVVVSANGAEEAGAGDGVTIAYSENDTVATIKITDISDDIKIAAQATDIRTITVSTNGLADEVEPIKYSQNTVDDDPSFAPYIQLINKKEGYENFKVTYKYANSRELPIEEVGGKYFIPVTEDEELIDSDIKVNVTATQKVVRKISAATDVSGAQYGQNGSLTLIASEGAEINPTKDLTILADFAEPGKKLDKYIVSINGTDKEYEAIFGGDVDYPGKAVIPASDLTGNVYIKAVKGIDLSYKVTFDEEDNFYTVASGNGVAKYGKDYYFNITPADRFEKLPIRYYVGAEPADEYKTTLDFAEDGKYMIPGEDITGDLTIEVADGWIAKYYTASLAKDVAGIQVRVLSQDGLESAMPLKANTPIENIVNWLVDEEHPENNKPLTFVVSDNNFATRDLPTVTATCNGNAIKVDLIDKTIRDTGNDGEFYYEINKKYLKGDIKISVTAATTKSYNVNVVSANNITVAAATTAPQKKDFTFTVNPNAGYELKYVKATANGKNVKFKTGVSENSLPGKFTIAAADVTGDIEIEAHAEKADVTITIVSANAVVKKGSEVLPNKVKVKAHEDFTFTVEDNAPYAVTKVGTQGDYYTLLGYAADEYTISGTDITKDFSIVINTGVTYTLDYDDTIVDVKASTGNKKVDVLAKTFVLSDEDTDVTLTATLNDGAKVENVYGFELAGTSVSVNGVHYKALDKNAQVTIAKKDITGDIKIAPKAIQNVVLLKAGIPVTDAKVQVDSANKDSFTLRAFDGLEGISVNSVDSHVQALGDAYKTSKVVFGDADLGKTVTVKAKANGKDVAFTFVVKAEATKLTIKEFKNNNVNQLGGSKATYTVVPTPSNGDLSGLVVSVNDATVATTADGKFTFDESLADYPAKIKVTAKTPTSDEYVGYINVNFDAITKNAPTVALNYATDTKLNVTLSLPKGVDKETKGMYYVVSVNKINADKTLTPCSYTNGTEYSAGSGYSSRTEDLVVDTTHPEGQGDAANYRVTVKLIQKKSVIRATSKEASKDVATLKPYIETKLGATKKTTKLWQGDSNVLVAIAKFDKKATWTETLKSVEVFEADGVTKASAYDFSIGGTCSEDMYNTNVVLGVDEYATPGKYIVRLTARIPAGSDIVPSSVDVPITVVERIGFPYNTTLTGPTEIYKPAGKAVSYTAKVTYDKTVATKKVSWDLDPTSKKAGITIKNGKVSIPKNYIVQDPDGDTVTVIAYAEDCAYNKAIGTRESASKSFKITSQPCDIADVRLDTDTAKSMDGQTYNYSDIVGNYIKVYDGTNNEITDQSRYTIKSSSKNLVVEADGEVSAVKPGKYTLTVTANDGSKKSKKVSFTVGYSTAPLEVMVSTYDDTLLLDVGETYAVNPYSLVENPGLVLFIGASDGNAINASYSVAGAKIVDKQEFGDSMLALLIPNKAETKITVTDKNTKAKTVYTIKNVKYEKQIAVKSPSLKDVSGKLYADMKNGVTQNIRFDVSKIPATVAAVDGEAYKAKISANMETMTKAGNKNDPTEIMGYYSLLGAAGMYGGMMEVNIVNNQIIIPITNSGYTHMTAGKYKFDVEIVKYDKQTGAELAVIGKPVTVTVNLQKTPKSSYKLTTGYKLYATSSAYADLTGKATSSTVDFAAATTKLHNANVNGKANEFTSYFKLEDGKLIVKNGKANVLTDKALKDNLTGYVEYVVTDAVTGAEKTMITKITVSLKK